MQLSPAQLSATTNRVLTAFFTDRGLALPHDDAQQRATARRRSYLMAIPEPLSKAVAEFNHTQMSEQDRRRRTGRRTLSAITLETRLRILRDLAVHLLARRQVTGWSEVTTTDLESFLARAPADRHQQTYLMRRFFAWARSRKLVLTDPARIGVLPGARPAPGDRTAGRAGPG